MVYDMGDRNNFLYKNLVLESLVFQEKGDYSYFNVIDAALKMWPLR